MTPMLAQGVTDREISATRVLRSVLFFVVMLAYGLNLALQHEIHVTGQRFYGWTVLVLAVLITTMSARGIDITHWARTLCFTLLSGLLIGLGIMAGIQGLYQIPTLLAFPVGVCWIEIWLAFIVVARRRNADQVAALCQTPGAQSSKNKNGILR